MTLLHSRTRSEHTMTLLGLLELLWDKSGLSKTLDMMFEAYLRIHIWLEKSLILSILLGYLLLLMTLNLVDDVRLNLKTSLWNWDSFEPWWFSSFRFAEIYIFGNVQLNETRCESAFSMCIWSGHKFLRCSNYSIDKQLNLAFDIALFNKLVAYADFFICFSGESDWILRSTIVYVRLLSSCLEVESFGGFTTFL